VLRPDRLAEHLVVAQLTASLELAGQCVSRLYERQAVRALDRLLPLLDRVVAPAAC
jgi:hypothetical protein